MLIAIHHALWHVTMPALHGQGLLAYYLDYLQTHIELPAQQRHGTGQSCQTVCKHQDYHHLFCYAGYVKAYTSSTCY